MDTTTEGVKAMGILVELVKLHDRALKQAEREKVLHIARAWGSLADILTEAIEEAIMLNQLKRKG
jgi:hypothetical protein